MNARSVLFIIFGLGLGIFLFLKSPKKTFNAENEIPNTLDQTHDQASPSLITSTKKPESENLTPPKGEDIKSKEKNDLNQPVIKKIMDDSKSEFNPKKEVRYKVIEGYAIASEDIILGQPKDKNETSGQTSLVSEEVLLWPSTELHYAFDVNLSETLKQRVLSALKNFAQKTSFVFTPYSGYEKDFLVFTASEKLCASYVGRIGGAQPILVNPNCRESEITHEVIHALGFIHEHQRDIRDQYLDIQFNNIQEDKLINFDILPQAFQNTYKNTSDGIDLKSLMIYPSNAFVIQPELYSILVKRSEGKIPENKGLSDMDLEKINNLYFRKF